MGLLTGEAIEQGDFVSTSAGSGDSGKAPKLDANGKLDDSFIRPVVRRTYTLDDTWSKPTGIKYVIVKLWGGGGSGASQTNTGGGTQVATGGGGGEYAEKRIEASSLNSTEAVTVGAGGTAVASANNGNPGGDTSFGSHITAAGGQGGTRENNYNSGDLIPGGAGGDNSNIGYLHSGSTTLAHNLMDVSVGASASRDFTLFLNGIYSAAGGSIINDHTASTKKGGNSVYGGAGGGAASEGQTPGSGGVSRYGGNGGAAGTTNGVAATSGSIPGGGGGAHADTSGNSGAGARGEVIVEEYYL